MRRRLGAHIEIELPGQGLVDAGEDAAPAGEPVEIVAEAADPVAAGELGLTAHRLGVRQVVEAEVGRHVRLVVAAIVRQRAADIGPLGEAGAPPTVVFGHRVELRQVEGDRPHAVQGFQPLAPALDELLLIARRQTVLSLETPEQQVALLVAPRPAEVATVVRRGLDELEDPATRRVALRLAEHWAASDLAAIENFAQWCGCLESEAERQAHQAGVLARNPAMAERIAALHQRGARVFAAVGALHMTGPEGLPALLARRGFQVELLLPQAGRH